MQELDRNSLRSDGGPVGHLMIKGVDLGSVRAQDLFRRAQYDGLQSRIAQLAPRALDLVTIVISQGRTVLRKILERRAETV